MMLFLTLAEQPEGEEPAEHRARERHRRTKGQGRHRGGRTRHSPRAQRVLRRWQHWGSRLTGTGIPNMLVFGVSLPSPPLRRLSAPGHALLRPVSLALCSVPLSPAPAAPSETLRPSCTSAPRLLLPLVCAESARSSLPGSPAVPQ